MIIEVRTYTLVPGVRDEFTDWFVLEARPAMEAAGMRVMDPLHSVTDPNEFVYIRTWKNDEERNRLCSAFYDSEQWQAELQDRALELEQDYSVRLLRTTSSGCFPGEHV